MMVRFGGLGSGGGIPDVSARYWRVRGLDNIRLGFASALSAAAVDFRTVIGGSNVATGGTPSASSQSQGAASNAFDGNSGTSWITNNTGFGTHWIKYDFGSPIIIREIVWSKRPDSFGVNETAAVGEVQYSTDDVNWTTLWTFVDFTPWSTGAETRAYAKSTALPVNKHWRVSVSKTAFSEFASVTNTSIAKLAMRITPGGADRCTGGTATAFNGDPDFAFDGSGTTIWNPSKTAPWDIQYTFPSTENIVEIALTSRNDNLYGDSPTEFQLQTRDGPLNVIKTFKTGPWGRGETRVFNVSSYVDEPERFIRLRPTGVHGGASARFSCTQVEFRTSIGGANIATGGTPFAKDNEGTNYPANAFDGVSSTRYAQNLVGNFPGNYIGYHLTSPIANDVVQVALTASNEAWGPSEAPTGFVVEYGSGNTWTTLWTEAGIGTWTANQTKVFTKP